MILNNVQNNNIFKRKNAFTLIELLVVISIIAVLAAFTFVTYQGARKSARDAKRKADLEQIKNSIEMYKQEKGVFPPQLSSFDTSVGNFSGSCVAGSDWAAGGLKVLEPNYFTKLPLDPLNDCLHYYAYEPVTTNANGIYIDYWLGAALENSNDKDISDCSSIFSGGTPINYCFKVN